MSTYVQGLRSAETVEKVKWLKEELSIIRRPEGVGKPDPLFGTDHSGDAAVHIIYPVSTKIKLTRSRISALARFSEAIHDRIRQLPLDVIAYVRFIETNR